MKTLLKKAEDIQYDFVNGFAKTRVLEEAHKYVKLYKCILRAGYTHTLSLHDDCFEVFAFVRGTGAIITLEASYVISTKESAYFIPNFNNERVDLHAGSDVEFVLFETILTESDKLAFHDTHMFLPFFKTASDLFRYEQACKGPKTKSYSIIPSKKLGRILMGIVLADGEGTDEKGHPAVHQWNYILPEGNITVTVDGDSFGMKDGDFNFITAGYDHSLLADPGKKCNYIWFEWFVDPKSVTENIIWQEYGRNN